MTATEMRIDEECLTVNEVAQRLKLKPDTIRRLFANEPGVIVLSMHRKGKRAYRTLRIPSSVYQRVVTRMSRVV